MKKMKVSLCLALLLLVSLSQPSLSRASEIRYSENINLKVVRSSKQFKFIEIHNNRENPLFEVPINEMRFFIESGRDLADFEQRKKDLVQVLVFGLSSYLFVAVNLAIALGASLALNDFLPEPDPMIERVSMSDLPYILYSTNEDVTEHSQEFDVGEVIASLVSIYEEYSGRMVALHKHHAKFSVESELSKVECDNNSDGDWWVNFDKGEATRWSIGRFRARSAKDSSKYQSFQIFLEDVEQKLGERELHWPGYRSDDPVAEITFDKNYGNIHAISLGSSSSARFDMSRFDFRTLFANLGTLTNSVDRNLLVENSRLKRAYDWAAALKFCQDSF